MKDPGAKSEKAPERSQNQEEVIAEVIRS